MAVTSTNNLRQGSSGSDVLELQKLLNSAGNYNLAEDGVFGNQTLSAVKDYQQKNSLAVDGIVGTQTWGALNKAQSGTSGSTQATEAAKTPSFEYKPYTPSDTVAQADAMLQQYLTQKPGAYQSTWQTQLNDIIQQIQNREDFSYDLNKDALYQQYADQHVTQGKMASMDVMGQAAAMTGGYGNSYAQSVGQQAYQGYLQQLNDKVPELYQLALDQHNREGDELYDQASLLAGMEEQDYGRYRDQLSDYYTELDRLTEDSRYQAEQDYGKWADDQSFGYQQYRDQIGDEQWQAQFDEAKRQYDQQYALSTGKTGGSDSTEYTDDTDYTGYDNGGVGTSAIKQMQRLLKVTEDGKWGPQSRAAAMKKYGISDPAELYKKLHQVEPPEPEEEPVTYDTVVKDLNQLIAYAGDPNSKETMESLWDGMSTLLKDALREGHISKSEYNKLWSLYGPIGNAYN